MQRVAIFDCDRLFEAGNFRCTQVNRYSPNVSTKVDNDLLQCLKKSRRLLKGLEQSFKITREYEDELAKCRQEHACNHTRDKNSGKTSNGYATTGKSVPLRSHASVECSSASVMEPQYQGILKTQLELAHLHKSLMGMAEKYLMLKHKKKLQKTRYKGKIAELKRTLRELVSAVGTKHRELTERLSQLSGLEHHAAVLLLVAEMTKSNDLLLENIKLKTKVEMLTMD